MTGTPIQTHDLKRASAAGLLDAIEIITSTFTRSEPSPAVPERLGLDEIITIPSVFQVRGEEISDQHMSALVEVLRREGDLKPVIVWRCGTCAVLIDGHYRLRAYKRLKKQAVDATIPVVWLQGDLMKAINAAASANNEVKLPLNNLQRMNFAWRLVIINRHSKKETASMAGISERSVANMRAVLKLLEQSGTSRGEMPLSWWHASREARRLDTNNERLDYEDFKHQQAQEWADRLAKTFSTRLAASPDVAAMALDIHLGRRAAEVGRLMLIEAGDPLREQIEDEMEVDIPF